MSLAILLLGIVLVVLLYRGEQRRDFVRSAAAVRVGEDTSAVLGALGMPDRRCAPGALEHLAGADSVLPRLRSGTAARWIWGGSGCDPRGGETEIGVGLDGRVLWVMPEHGAAPLELP